MVPERYRWLYGLNPMAGVIDGFRWALTGNGHPPAPILYASAAMVCVAGLRRPNFLSIAWKARSLTAYDEYGHPNRSLGKEYRRGLGGPSDLLRDTLAKAIRSPASLFRRQRAEKFWALRNVSLEVHEGEVLGLIGRNGSGKTTLLKILSRITRPTEGWAEIHGRVGSLLEVGTGFHPELTGRENTYLSGAILGMSKQEIARKFDEIVAFAEMEKFIDTPVKHYSSGMYVRLAFAVAAHLEPEILLVDEVLAVGESVSRRNAWARWVMLRGWSHRHPGHPSAQSDSPPVSPSGVAGWWRIAPHWPDGGSGECL